MFYLLNSWEVVCLGIDLAASCLADIPKITVNVLFYDERTLIHAISEPDFEDSIITLVAGWVSVLARVGHGKRCVSRHPTSSICTPKMRKIRHPAAIMMYR